MNLSKDKKTGKWLCQFYYTDWQGSRKKKFKRGFRTKSEAEAWARDFLQQQESNLEMRFDKFVEIYLEDMEARLKENTVRTKRYRIYELQKFSLLLFSDSFSRSTIIQHHS